MPIVAPNPSYWDRVAETKRFSHPLRRDWLQRYVDSSGKILDYGCGYGRTLRKLGELGYRNVFGVDFSKGMLSRCRREFPHMNLIQNEGCTLPVKSYSLDAVMLFTILTCVPHDEDQRRIMNEVERVLIPGGVIYMSDLMLNEDLRNRERYEENVHRFGTYGVFELPEGVVVRHHAMEWVEELTAAFTRLEYERFLATTMNGNLSSAFQYLGAKEV